MPPAVVQTSHTAFRCVAARHIGEMAGFVLEAKPNQD